MSEFPTVLVTGGAGFIGSHFVRLLRRERPSWNVVTLDALTYAGRKAWMDELEADPGHRFIEADIRDTDLVQDIVSWNSVTHVVNFAAESHVARSILDPGLFADVNVMGTVSLLEAARNNEVKRFLQVSTDEVYGEVISGASTEDTTLAPRNPYSASKAAAEHMALSYWHTYGLPVVVTRGGNNYGPRQYPEKLIPVTVARALRGEPLVVHGNGSQVRDWIHAEDHCRGILAALEHGDAGETYNVSAGELRTNLDVVQTVAGLVGTGTITHTADRPAQDRRYAMDPTKLRGLGWEPRINFETGIAETVSWYRANADWCRGIVGTT